MNFLASLSFYYETVSTLAHALNGFWVGSAFALYTSYWYKVFSDRNQAVYALRQGLLDDKTHSHTEVLKAYRSLPEYEVMHKDSVNWPIDKLTTTTLKDILDDLDA